MIDNINKLHYEFVHGKLLCDIDEKVPYNSLRVTNDKDSVTCSECKKALRIKGYVKRRFTLYKKQTAIKVKED